MMTNFTPYMAVATLAYALMTVGLLNRKNKQRHVRLMAIAITLDVLIVLILELQKDAVQTALDFSLAPLQQLHVGTSSIAVLLYIPVVYLGFKRFRGLGDLNTRLWHIRLGIGAFIFRTLGFILMFSLLWPRPS
jgi:hypothetical protein